VRSLESAAAEGSDLAGTRSSGSCIASSPGGFSTRFCCDAVDPAELVQGRWGRHVGFTRTLRPCARNGDDENRADERARPAGCRLIGAKATTRQRTEYGLLGQRPRRTMTTSETRSAPCRLVLRRSKNPSTFRRSRRLKAWASDHHQRDRGRSAVASTPGIDSKASASRRPGPPPRLAQSAETEARRLSGTRRSAGTHGHSTTTAEPGRVRACLKARVVPTGRGRDASMRSQELPEFGPSGQTSRRQCFAVVSRRNVQDRGVRR
jgi:hypothetical protein